MLIYKPFLMCYNLFLHDALKRMRLTVHNTEQVIKSPKYFLKKERVNRLSLNQNVAKVIHGFRTEANMTLLELAEAAGVCLLTAYRWDHGHTKPNRTNIITLAEIFQISPKKLKSLLASETT